MRQPTWKSLRAVVVHEEKLDLAVAVCRDENIRRDQIAVHKAMVVEPPNGFSQRRNPRSLDRQAVAPAQQLCQKLRQRLAFNLFCHDETSLNQAAAPQLAGGEHERRVKSRRRKRQSLAPEPKALGNAEHVFECAQIRRVVKYFEKYFLAISRSIDLDRPGMLRHWFCHDAGQDPLLQILAPPPRQDLQTPDAEAPFLIVICLRHGRFPRRSGAATPARLCRRSRRW